MNETVLEQDTTFSDQVASILIEEISEEKKINNLKKLFLGNQYPLVTKIIKGQTTFSEIIRPLMVEYDKLKMTSLLTDVCMNEEFMQKGKKLKDEASGVIRWEFDIVTNNGGRVKSCDVTASLSRNALVKKTYEENNAPLNIFAVFLLFYLLSPIFLDLSVSIVVDFLEILEGFLFTSFFIVTSVFIIGLYKNYIVEYKLRKDTCVIVCLQAVKLDEIVNELFFNRK